MAGKLPNPYLKLHHQCQIEVCNGLQTPHISLLEMSLLSNLRNHHQFQGFLKFAQHVYSKSKERVPKSRKTN